MQHHGPFAFRRIVAERLQSPWRWTRELCSYTIRHTHATPNTRDAHDTFFFVTHNRCGAIEDEQERHIGAVPRLHYPHAPPTPHPRPTTPHPAYATITTRSFFVTQNRCGAIEDEQERNTRAVPLLYHILQRRRRLHHHLLGEHAHAG